MNVRLVLAVVPLVLLVAGCGDDSTSTAKGSAAPTTKAPSKPAAKAPSGCSKLSKPALATIAGGLTKKATLLEGQAVKLPADEAQFGVAYVAAVKVHDTAGDQVTILGLSALTGPGTIIGADALAHLYFSWGTAATKTSPMGQYQNTLFLSKASQTAQGCL